MASYSKYEALGSACGTVFELVALINLNIICVKNLAAGY